MAYSFPLTEAQFADRLTTDMGSFTLTEARIHDETESGEILTARRGTRLWRGKARIVIDTARNMEPLRGLVDLLCGANASFLIGDRACRFPAADPTGILGLLDPEMVTVQAAGPDRRELVLQGAPVGYVLTEGDHLSIAVGSGVISYHRVIQGGTFSGSFDPTRTGTLEVQPTLPAAVAPGDVVTLVRPVLKAVIVPGSVSGGDRILPDFATPLTFDWIQTLR